MAIFDLFSKRQRRARGEVPDVYQYETLPVEFRTQVLEPRRIRSNTKDATLQSDKGSPGDNFLTLVFLLVGAGFAATPEEWWVRALGAFVVLSLGYRFGAREIPDATPYESDPNVNTAWKTYAPPPPNRPSPKSWQPRPLDIVLLLIGMSAAALPLALGWRWIIASVGIYSAFKVGGRNTRRKGDLAASVHVR
jgi:hypothetical protein